MQQPVPNVFRADVERIVRRDFPVEDRSRVLSILDEYRPESGEPSRVQLAVLKLAAGDIASLRREIERAKYDFRDVLVAAEYPKDWEAHLRKDVSIDDMPPDEREKIYEQDWQQYEAWLKRLA